MGLEDNPYKGNEYPLVVLYKAKESGSGTGKVFEPEFSEVAFEFPINGPVRFTQSVKTKEDQITNGPISQTKIELQGYDNAEASFTVELVTDNPAYKEKGTPESDLESALDKYTEIYNAFTAVNEEGIPPVYSVQYPLIDSTNMTLAFISRLEANDAEGQDFITVNITLKQVIPNLKKPPAKKKSNASKKNCTCVCVCECGEQ